MIKQLCALSELAFQDDKYQTGQQKKYNVKQQI